MIQFRFVQDRGLALECARRLGDREAEAILARGTILGAGDAGVVARFYWRMVDATVEEDVEPELERLHNAFSAACFHAGYADIWDEEVSRA